MTIQYQGKKRIIINSKGNVEDSHEFYFYSFGIDKVLILQLIFALNSFHQSI